MRAEEVERGYDGIESRASYYDNSGVARYRAEARAVVAWRDAVSQTLELQVLAPPDGIETWEQVRAVAAVGDVRLAGEGGAAAGDGKPNRCSLRRLTQQILSSGVRSVY